MYRYLRYHTSQNQQICKVRKNVQPFFPVTNFPHLKAHSGHLPTHRSLKFFPVEALRGLLAASVSHLAIDFTGGFWALEPQNLRKFSG